jgi:hypothetical protein
MPTVKPGVDPFCWTVMANAPWLLLDPHAVVAGLQSKVAFTAPVSVAVQLELSPGFRGLLLPPHAVIAITTATHPTRMFFLPKSGPIRD